MRSCSLRILAVSALFLASATTTLAQKPEFSADLTMFDTNGHTDVLKLYVGNQRARFERTGESGGINTLIIDFYHQILYLLVPQAKMYMRIAGSEGTPFYQAATIFRPASPDQPCGQWIAEADRRRINLKCRLAGEDRVDTRPTQKWEALTTKGAHGSLWYDKELDFIVKVMRISVDGAQSGYELRNIRQGPQSQELFDPHANYRPFSINNLVDVLTGVSEW